MLNAEPSIELTFKARFDIFSAKQKFKQNLRSIAVEEIFDVYGTHVLQLKDHEIGELPNGEKDGAAYTKGKGHIYICCITKGKLNDENDTFFVCLHELAHVMSNSYGHGEEFKTNFNFIVKLAVKLGLWKDPKYEEKSVDYCGVQVTTSPCSYGSCEKNSLDYYFKESLLDYK